MSLAESEYAEHELELVAALVGERLDGHGLGRAVQRLAHQPARVHAVDALGHGAQSARDGPAGSR